MAKVIDANRNITVPASKYFELERKAYSVERQLEAILDNLLVGEKAGTVIKYLLYVGFRPESLQDYGFSETDIEDAVKEMDEMTDFSGICPTF